MTLKQFNETRYGKGMYFTVEGHRMSLDAVNFLCQCVGTCAYPEDVSANYYDDEIAYFHHDRCILEETV
jgi:hypothetical protein